MSVHPLPSAPEIPGHTFESFVASGGFGDVFAFRDNLDRRVAVKVLRLSAATPEKLAEFRSEASLMASLEHDHVVRVNTFATAADGRPYISMEYCSGHLGAVSRERQLPVHEALSYGVKIASAVDAAHARGLYHRDIKPANVLVKANGQPALTDFGIAGGRDVAVGQRGVSLQYGAPEVVDERTDGEVLADVYSLGATLFALLAGHSPLHDAAGANDEASIIERSLRGPRRPTGRSDVPASLEDLLQRTLAVNPQLRPQSAMAFGRALQQIETELGFVPTKVPFAADTARAAQPVVRAPGDEGSTRVAPQRVSPGGTEPTTPHGQDAATSQRRAVAEAPQTPSGAAPDGGTRPPVRSETIVRGGVLVPPAATTPSTPDEAAPASTEGADESRRSPRGLVVAGASALVLLLGGAAVVTGGGADADQAPTSTDEPTAAPVDTSGLFDDPDVPTGVTITRTGDDATIRWDASDQEGASYVVSFSAGARTGSSQQVTSPELVLPLAEVGEDVCVRVLGVVGASSSVPSDEGCLR